jgi:hypothetical protein
MWKTVNRCIDGVNKHSQNLNQLSRDIATVSGRKVLSYDLYPFKIHQLPITFQPQPVDTTVSWLTYRVRGGYVFTYQVSGSMYVQGTDRAESYAYDNTYPSYSSSYDITLTAGVSQNWFWIEDAGSGSYFMRYGVNPAAASTGNPNPWTTFPAASSTHIPIGVVDTYSSQSQYQAIVRQFLTEDILSMGGGSSSVNLWKTFDLSASYSVGDEVVVDPYKIPTYSIPLVTYPNTSTVPMLTPGLFMCQIAVPLLTLMSSSISSSVTSSRNSYNCWYPHYPTEPMSSLKTVSGSAANQVIWKPLSPQFLDQNCLSDGTITQTWINGFLSMSFNMAQLPAP